MYIFVCLNEAGDGVVF